MKKLCSALLLLCLSVDAFALSISKSFVFEDADGKVSILNFKKQSSTQRLLSAGYGPTLTFAKDYSRGRSLDADYSVGSKTATFTATRASGSPGTYVDESGIIQSMPATDNTPRWTSGFYTDTGFVSRPGLIVEGASTNLSYDSYFSQAIATYWTAGGTGVITSDTTYSNVYGGGQVLKFVGSADLDRFASANGKTLSFAASTLYTVSTIVRGSGTIKLRYADGAGNLNYGTNTFALSDKWTRITDSFTTSADAPSGLGRIGWAQVGATNVTAYFSAIQVEALPFASSFIPTTTAALTRNAETLTYLISGNRTAATESVFVKFTAFQNGNNGATRYLFDTEASAGSVRQAYTISNATKIGTFNGASLVGSTSISAFTSYVYGGVFAATGNPNIVQYLDGASDATDNTDITMTLGTNFFVGSHRTTANLQIAGIISSLAIFSDAKASGDVSNITNLINGNI